VLFHPAIIVTGKQPKTLITDGLRSYAIACDQVFDDDVKHIRHITFKGDRNNNRMEKLNGEIRDREKTMRGLKRRRTPILTGYQLFHNYIRTHEGLNGKTPAEACGIKIEGNNKWITLIQNASKKSKASGSFSSIRFISLTSNSFLCFYRCANYHRKNQQMHSLVLFHRNS